MQESEGGKVFLIGAGPGDPELITVRGKRRLEICDVVVYDHLIPDELVVTLPDRIEKRYVGKQAGHHSLPQDEINALLASLAREGKKVGRLKGADPLIFGRGGEEARFLKEGGIPFEIIPGVTAAVGAAAYSGIPCTDRTRASFVTFATGHKAKDTSVATVPWEKFAGCEGGTLIIYMGVGEVASIVGKLLAGGRKASTPAAVVERGTHSTQRRIVSTLGDLPDLVKREKVQPPALFFIGNVVELAGQIEWFGSRPLYGKRIMVTRPADQAQDLYDSLRFWGAQVMPYPTIATRENVDLKAWGKFRKIDRDKRWLIFTSENGVRYFIHQLTEIVGDIRRLADYKIAAVGFGTARALWSLNLKSDFVPSKATTEVLASELCEKHDLEGAAIVRVQGNLSNKKIKESLAEAGAEVLDLEVYQTFHPTWPEGIKQKLFETPPHIITFTSGSTAEGLHKILGPEEAREIISGADAASIGPMTTKVLAGYGITPAIEAELHSVPGLVEAIVKHYNPQLSEK